MATQEINIRLTNRAEAMLITWYSEDPDMIELFVKNSKQSTDSSISIPLLELHEQLTKLIQIAEQ